MFDKKTCEGIATDIEIALAEVAEKHGVTIKNNGGKFSMSKLELKLEITTNDEDALRKEFGLRGAAYGLSAKHFGAKFTSRGKTYELIDIHPRKKKYPFIARQLETGKQFKFPVSTKSKILAENI